MQKLSNARPYLSILLYPTTIAVLAAGLWYVLFYHTQFDVGKSDETALTNTLIPVLAAFHSILAAAVLSKVWEEYKTIRRCVQNHDREGFARCLRDRIPPAIHLLLAVMSVLIVVGTMLVHYDNVGAGILVVGAISFVLALYWQVATNLDNPQCGAWYVNEVPTEWRTQTNADPLSSKVSTSAKESPPFL
jgi:1,4-dihydroxy-2-naphthoate octaprenyltransferase